MSTKGKYLLSINNLSKIYISYLKSKKAKVYYDSTYRPHFNTHSNN